MVADEAGDGVDRSDLGGDGQILLDERLEAGAPIAGEQLADARNPEFLDRRGGPGCDMGFK